MQADRQTDTRERRCMCRWGRRLCWQSWQWIKRQVLQVSTVSIHSCQNDARRYPRVCVCGCPCPVLWEKYENVLVWKQVWLLIWMQKRPARMRGWIMKSEFGANRRNHGTDEQRTKHMREMASKTPALNFVNTSPTERRACVCFRWKRRRPFNSRVGQHKYTSVAGSHTRAQTKSVDIKTCVDSLNWRRIRWKEAKKRMGKKIVWQNWNAGESWKRTTDSSSEKPHPPFFFDRQKERERERKEGGKGKERNGCDNHFRNQMKMTSSNQ